MFLKSIIRWQYGDDSARLINESELIEEITYKVDGTVRREITDEKAHERTVTDYRDVNLDINWEPVPEFGDWGSITRFDRDKPARQA
ncbi:hypothetical protein EV192_102986 [Actinocrispum wychmicini]|uniref:Uncharacterized protein n=2 Tax=Actinocrispum wychmicini TaxID=1213861 RepID=A0A4R2JUG9_9PSEU|nr:hypothetical protein EV192_102986 [Actinocrispum wychmicini]